MNAPMQHSALQTLEEMSERFFATPLAQFDHAALDRWRPRKTLYGRLRPLLARQAGSRICASQVDGQLLHYWDNGKVDAPVVVLLHGFGASKENWGFLGARLHRRYRLLVPDLPGFGDSHFNPQASYEMSEQADRVATWLRDLKVEKAQIVGSSMGGAITAQLAARHPDLVSGICLMNAAGTPGRRISLLESGLSAGRNYLSPATPAQTAEVFSICLHRRKRLLGMGLSLMVAGEMSHRKPVNDFLFSHLVSSLTSTWLSLESITAPTLVLWGDSDQVLDPTCVESFCERISQARAMVLPGVGHLPMLEEPALTSRILNDFWQSDWE